VNFRGKLDFPVRQYQDRLLPAQEGEKSVTGEGGRHCFTNYINNRQELTERIEIVVI
jgi:hypothetical protein